MAGRQRLSGLPRRRWLALVAAVLLAHLVSLDWVGRQLREAELLPRMAEPMFTRVLQQEAPPAAPEPPAAAAPAPARPEARTIVADRAPRKPAPPASAAEPVAEPEPAPPEPAPAAEAPVVAASEPPATVTADAGARAASEPGPAASDAAAPASAAQAAASAAGANLDAWPVDTRLNYRLGGAFRSGELHGAARVQWLRQEQRYEVKIDIDVTLLASLALTSHGLVTPQGLRPEAYEELRRSGVRRVTLRDDSIQLGNGNVLPRPAGVQDTASQFVELSHRFASGLEPLEVGRSVSFWMARPGGIDLWTYDVVERETLHTPQLGAVEAFHLKPRPLANPRGNITAEMWFAPTLHYLPVRIRVNMDPAYVDLIVESIEQR